MNNYRHISVIAAVAKIFERITYDDQVKLTFLNTT